MNNAPETSADNPSLKVELLSDDDFEALEEILRRVLQPRHSERRRDGSE